MERVLLVKYPETKLTVSFGLRISIIKLKNTFIKAELLSKHWEISKKNSFVEQLSLKPPFPFQNRKMMTLRRGTFLNTKGLQHQ